MLLAVILPHLYIFPRVPLVHPSVHPKQLKTGRAVGPRNLIFGMEVGFGPGLLIFGKSRSKVMVMKMRKYV